MIKNKKEHETWEDVVVMLVFCSIDGEREGERELEHRWITGMKNVAWLKDKGNSWDQRVKDKQSTITHTHSLPHHPQTRLIWGPSNCTPARVIGPLRANGSFIKVARKIRPVKKQLTCRIIKLLDQLGNLSAIYYFGITKVNTVFISIVFISVTFSNTERNWRGREPPSADHRIKGSHMGGQWTVHLRRADKSSFCGIMALHRTYFTAAEE